MDLDKTKGLIFGLDHLATRLAEKKENVPFNRTYWVTPGRFLAGCYPGSEGKDKSYQQLKALLGHGIRYVINLMEPDESNWDIHL